MAGRWHAREKTMTRRVPSQLGARLEGVTAAPTPQTETQTRGRVLVVEDDAHIRDLVVLHLQLEGLTPVAAADGTTGLKLAKADPFDLLILDLMLPGIDGVTLCRAVRRESIRTSR